MPPSATSGTFTCTALQKVTAKIDKVWAENQTNSDYVANVEVLTALRKEQTARLQEIENPVKDKVLKIFWVADCNTGVADCDGDDCDLDGPEAETRCLDYALNICKQVKFTLRENFFRGQEVSKEEVLAIQMLARMKELDEALAQAAAASLNSFLGVNQFTGGIGDVSGLTTFIAANYWGPDMYGYFAQVKVKNKFSNPFLIHGNNLYQHYWNATFNQANANNKDQLAKLQSMRSYWDMFNIDLVNSPDNVSYMIERGAVAFATKAYYDSNPVEYLGAGQIRWSVESKSLPGVRYDVIYKNRCQGEEIYHDYKIKVKAGIFLNPIGCNPDKTGVLKFVCGADSGS